jgi:hypothetical protein
VDAQLLHEMLTMLFHGFDTDPEFGGDLFVGLAFGNQLQDAFFAGSEARAFSLSQNGRVRCLLIVFVKILGNRRAPFTCALANRFDECRLRFA